VAHKSIKEFYVKSLEEQLKKATEAGIPESSDFVKDYRSVIGKIKAL